MAWSVGLSDMDWIDTIWTTAMWVLLGIAAAVACAVSRRGDRDRRLDDVPSPGTVVLVSLGVMVMMRRRR